MQNQSNEFILKKINYPVSEIESDEQSKQSHKLTDPNDLALYIELRHAGALLNKALDAYSEVIDGILANGKQFGLYFLAEVVKKKLGDVMKTKWPC